jgi:[ribosomal protein S5]-alanine N-acetyltransferase
MPAPVGPVLASGTLAHSPQPELHAAGLLLRPWRDDERDVIVVARALEEPEIRRWFPDSRGGLDEARRWLAVRRQRWQSEAGADWAVCEDGTIVGRVALVRLDLALASSEVAYWTLPEGRGRGVTARSLVAVSDWAFTTVGLHRLELLHSVHNPGSCGVARRAGFTLEGTARQRMLHGDGWHDMHLHARLAGDRAAAR